MPTKILLTSVAMLVVSASAFADESDELDEILRGYADRGLFSGVVRIERELAPVFERAYGMASEELGAPSAPEHRYKLHSMSKPILAVAIMRMVEQERLDLDTSICKYLSPCPESWAAVTPRHLLNHTSGIPDFTDDLLGQWQGSLDQTLLHLKDRLQALEPVSAPGEAWAYSNSGYVLLSRMLEIAYKRPIHEVLDELVFAPAGMTGAALEHSPEHGQMYDGQLVEAGAVPGYNGSPGALQSAYMKMYVIPGAGGVVAATADLARFVGAVFTGELISADARETMLTAPDPEVSGIYALGWISSEVDGRPVHHHSGGNNGFIAHFQYFPEEQLTLILLSNRGFTPGEDILADIHAVLFGSDG